MKSSISVDEFHGQHWDAVRPIGLGIHTTADICTRPPANLAVGLVSPTSLLARRESRPSLISLLGRAACDTSLYGDVENVPRHMLPTRVLSDFPSITAGEMDSRF